LLMLQQGVLKATLLLGRTARDAQKDAAAQRPNPLLLQQVGGALHELALHREHRKQLLRGGADKELERILATEKIGLHQSRKDVLAGIRYAPHTMHHTPHAIRTHYTLCTTPHTLYAMHHAPHTTRYTPCTTRHTPYAIRHTNISDPII
jgi:hypothetical protein